MHHEVVATWRKSILDIVGDESVGGVVAQQLDLCDAVSVGAAFDRHRPELVIHGASTHGDRADVVDATEAVALASRDLSLIHI